MDPLLTLDEVAELLRVDVQTVRRWCRSGALEAVKVGRVWRVRPEVVAKVQARGTKG